MLLWARSAKKDIRDYEHVAIPTVRFKGLPAEVVGYWSLWRITLDHQSLRDVKIIPIFHRRGLSKPNRNYASWPAASRSLRSRVLPSIRSYRGGVTLPGWIEMLAVSLLPSMVTTTGTLSPLVTPAGTVTSS